MSRVETISIVMTVAMAAIGAALTILWPNARPLGWLLLITGTLLVVAVLVNHIRNRDNYGGESAQTEGQDDYDSRTPAILRIGDVASDVDPIISVNCVDGREGVLIISADRPTRLAAQARIMAVPGSEVERGDPYRVTWRQPGSGGVTTQFQDLQIGRTATIVLGRVFHPTTDMKRVSVYLDVIGEGAAVVQRVEGSWPAQSATAEVSVNIMGGTAGHLVHAHHYLLTATRGSNVITVRPLAAPPVTSAAPGVVLSNSLKPKSK
jgi:hypothetical protein